MAFAITILVIVISISLIDTLVIIGLDVPSDERLFSWIVIGLILLVFFSPVFFILPPLTGGFMPDYSSGERTGYVTKISKRGMFWQTNEAQLQIGVGEMAALQEPFSFSITDPDVLQRIKEVAGSDSKVTVEYTQWFIQPLWRGRSGYEAVRVTTFTDPK